VPPSGRLLASIPARAKRALSHRAKAIARLFQRDGLSERHRNGVCWLGSRRVGLHRRTHLVPSLANTRPAAYIWTLFAEGGATNVIDRFYADR